MAVVGDDLRQFHPHYDRLMAEDPLAMPGATAAASGTWIGMSARYLREHRADVLIESTLRSGAAMLQTMRDYLESGYEVQVHALAVPAEISRLSTIDRYSTQFATIGAGRWTPGHIHDEAFRLALETLEDLASPGGVARVAIHDRAGDVLWDVELGDELGNVALGAMGAVQEELGATHDAVRARDTSGSHRMRDARMLSERFAQLRATNPGTISSHDATAWFAEVSRQLDVAREQRQDDPDFLATLLRVATEDAARMAECAWPESGSESEPTQRAERAELSEISSSSWTTARVREAREDTLSDLAERASWIEVPR